MFEIIKKNLLLHSWYYMCMNSNCLLITAAPLATDDTLSKVKSVRKWLHAMQCCRQALSSNACSLQSVQFLSCHRRERLHGGKRHSTFARGCWHTHENCMHAKQIIIIFYICFFIFIICYMYLVLFSIVLCRTIVTDSFQVPEVKGCKKQHG